MGKLAHELELCELQVQLCYEILGMEFQLAKLPSHCGEQKIKYINEKISKFNFSLISRDWIEVLMYENS